MSIADPIYGRIRPTLHAAEHLMAYRLSIYRCMQDCRWQTPAARAAELHLDDLLLVAPASTVGG
jgi:hypothetical protein